jgi:hypothetical protein
MLQRHSLLPLPFLEKSNGMSWRYLSAALLVLNAIGALPAGAMLMADPSGRLLGMRVHLLETSPFNDFFWPGLVLFLSNGVLSLVALAGLWARNRHAMRLVLLQGMVLIGWIVVQMLMLRTINPLQLTMLAIGGGLVIISVRNVN